MRENQATTSFEVNLMLSKDGAMSTTLYLEEPNWTGLDTEGQQKAQSLVLLN